MTAAREPGAAVRVVRGSPRPEELAAVLAVLTALTAAGRAVPSGPPGPPRAPWPNAVRPLTTAAPAWAAAPGPYWRTSPPG